jgi:DNA-binding response OmpR family regulator
MISEQKAHILYLEDDPDSRDLVKFMLGAAGMDVTAVDSAEEALQLARDGGFDLFLLDALLPSGYSYDLCPELRLAAPTVPIVFYTALGFPAEVQQGADAGADAYLIKPFLGDLAETLMNVIKDSEYRHFDKGPATVNHYRSAVPDPFAI